MNGNKAKKLRREAVRANVTVKSLKGLYYRLQRTDIGGRIIVKVRDGKD